MDGISLDGIKSIFTDEDKKGTRNTILGSLAGVAALGAGIAIGAKLKRKPKPIRTGMIDNIGKPQGNRGVEDIKWKPGELENLVKNVTDKF